jgi:hypothetical protein
MRTVLAALLVLLVPGWTSLAGDFASERLSNWHQWRGPNADGVSPDGDPPV